jgi:cyclopropane-fatty-acyl-phospholipid synthase
VAKSEADWMARYFFAGGTMPSDELLHFFQKDLTLVNQWRVSGWHYKMTAEAWLQRMDARKPEVLEILKATYPPGETQLWWMRWRAFYLACAELWGYDKGNVWHVSHYLFEKPKHG